MPPSPSLLAPRDPSIASRWKGSSRMKSKKGKAWRAMPAVGAGPGETCSPGPAGIGARVTWWTFQPGALRQEPRQFSLLRLRLKWQLLFSF